jgi:hypothetical protein
MAFVRKSVNPSERIGPDLIELRERVHLTLTEAARLTRITGSLLLTFEEDRWEDIDDPAYMERVLRSYVEFLGGNTAYILLKYRELMKGHERMARKPEEYLPRTRSVKPMDLVVSSRLLTVSAFVIFVLALSGYVWGQAFAISTPPLLEVQEPKEGARLEEPVVRVQGQTNAEAMLFVNGRGAIVQPDGSFSLLLNIPRGSTLIQITAKKRHGREASVTRRVVFDRALPQFQDGAIVVTSTGR